MPTDYYKILQVSPTVSKEEIENAYRQLIEKWQNLRAQQTPEIKKRSDKIIALIDEAYQILSVEKTRAIYDRQLNQTVEASSPMVTPKVHAKKIRPATKKNTTRLWVLVIIIALLIIVATYTLFIPHSFFSNQPDTVLEATPVTIPKKKTTPEPQNNASKKEITAPSTTKNKVETTAVNKIESKTAPQIGNTSTLQETKENNVIQTTNTNAIDKDQLKNANDPALKEMAKRLAEITNNHKNVVINFNTQFIEAKASNQNITLNFMVIDGIANSRTILDSYLTERFFYDNQICDVQKDNIEKGILFTFAYYNTQKELIGKYYIDKQVCASPMEKRLIKTPSEYQLNAIEIGEDGKPIQKQQETKTN